MVSVRRDSFHGKIDQQELQSRASGTEDDIYCVRDGEKVSRVANCGAERAHNA